MTGFLNKLLQQGTMNTNASSYKTHEHTVHEVISDSAPSCESSELDEDEEQEHPEEEYIHTSCSPTISPYSLTIGPLVRSRSRRIGGLSDRCAHPNLTASSSSGSGKPYHPLASPSNSDLTFPSSPASSRYVWEEGDSAQPGGTGLVDSSIHPSDHMKTLLSQLGSSISTSKATFLLMRASSSPLVSVEDTYNRAVITMEEELQTISNLHLSLYSLIQQHQYFGDGSYEPSISSCVPHMKRQDAMLKAYEGIITRFHDEMTRKGAVTEALKETLAKSMLRGEKLERRTKALEAKLSPMHYG